MPQSRQDPRTATVRDLRNRFADVAKWIDDGEQVIITRHGAPFATLAPTAAPIPRKADWAARFQRRPPLPAKRKLTKEETQSLYEEMKGDL